MIIEKLFFSQHLNRIMKVAVHKIKLLTCIPDIWQHKLAPPLFVL